MNTNKWKTTHKDHKENTEAETRQERKAQKLK